MLLTNLYTKKNELIADVTITTTRLLSKFSNHSSYFYETAKENVKTWSSLSY